MWGNNVVTNVTFFDIKKTFDSIPNDQLILSLFQMGIRGSLLHWFIDYLTNRKQRVVLDDFSSSFSPVTSGVPQGSILGLLLFIIFMNSITNLKQSPGAKLVLSTGDILLYKTVDSPLASQHLQQEVDKFSPGSHHTVSHQILKNSPSTSY